MDDEWAKITEKPTFANILPNKFAIYAVPCDYHL